MIIQETTKTNKKFGKSLSSTMTVSLSKKKLLVYIVSFDKNFVPDIGENSSIQTLKNNIFHTNILAWNDNALRSECKLEA